MLWSGELGREKVNITFILLLACSKLTDLESRFESVVLRMAAVQDAAKVQQAALSSLPGRVESMAQEQRKQHAALSGRVDDDLTALGEELALIKVVGGLDWARANGEIFSSF